MSMGAVVPLLREEVAPKRQTPLRKPNAALRTREHLTEHEIDKLIEAAKSTRNGHRDATMILIAYRHGLRASELCDLQWTQVHLNGANLDIRRRKNGSAATHPLTGLELRALRRLKREQEPASQFVFVSERGAPFSTEGFARLLQRAAVAAGLAIKVHPHMLRHACGYKLANDGVDTARCRPTSATRISNTVRYTEMAPGRFKGFWTD